MHPNLMRPPGFEPAGEQTRHRRDGPHSFSPSGGFLSAIAFEHLPMGHGFAAAFAHCHAVAGDFVPVDRPVDGAARAIGRTPDEGEIAALERRAVAAVAGEL